MQLTDNLPDIFGPEQTPPVWWHELGSEMTFEGPFFLRSDRAFLRFENWRGNTWRLEYRIHLGWDQHSSALRTFTREELEQAFGLREIEETEKIALELRLRVFGGADSFVEGQHIRSGPYLNIPGPGTGRRGDPNLSIKITPAMRAAVHKLIHG